jgi:hypothetical protein
MKPANAALLLKSECIRLGTALTSEDALRLIHTYINTVRLHSAIGYVAARHARWASY